MKKTNTSIVFLLVLFLMLLVNPDGVVAIEVTTTTVPYLTTSTVPYLTTSTVPYLTTSTVPYLTTSTLPYLTTSTLPFMTTSTLPFFTTSTIPVFSSTTTSIFPDGDGDGFPSNLDCNDGDFDINPDAMEICGDGIDQDCDGSDEDCTPNFDDDGDGFTGNEGDCDDTDASIYSGAEEICGDGIDQNCDGVDPYCYKLWYPHVASNVTWNTEICVINTSDVDSIDGEINAYSNAGVLIATMPVSLAANARRQFIVGDTFFNPENIGYLVFESNSEYMCGYTKFYILGQYRVAIPAISEVTAGDLYISHLASNDDWWTGISIVNTTSTAKNLTFTFDSGETKSVDLAANEHKAFSIKSLFGNVPQPDLKSAIIEDADGIVGLELFGKGNQLSGVLLKNSTTTDMYYPHIASNERWWTGIVAFNPSGAASTLTIKPFTADGVALATTNVSVGSNEKYIGTVKSLGLPLDSDWFQIESTQPITGFELFGTSDGNQLAGYTGVNINRSQGIFAKNDTDGWTGIAFVNIENATASVTLKAYNDSGTLIATDTFDLNAHEKLSDVAGDLFSSDISTATYIVYSSDRELVGFQLNGSSDNMLLDGLPGLQLMID